ncbi:MAG: exo-alpha-sialidase [Planctomycetota bacterium]|jgi:hypothetical protein|nr:exo-alpha-sialidase [Planctomycetota bacterium]
MDQPLRESLIRLAEALIDQKAARTLVWPQERREGFWFGGGDMIQDSDGTFLLAGRHRVFGDSRTGVGAGERGKELAIYQSSAFDQPFEKVKVFKKEDVATTDEAVVSIEGVSLLAHDGQIELYVSTEKDRPYPEGLIDYRKPGTGVWSIDVMSAADIASLEAGSARGAIRSDKPSRLHAKDPAVHVDSAGRKNMIFCSHPFSWSSSNPALARFEDGSWTIAEETILERGPVWDVAATRITDRLSVPRLGALRDLPPLSLYFYDGAECLRPHEQSERAIARPRGWSCEEIGGLAWGYDEAFPAMERLSVDRPFFTSPFGTGCSRYVSTLVTEDEIAASWQQSQEDLCQPLVGHSLPLEQVEQILAG